MSAMSTKLLKPLALVTTFLAAGCSQTTTTHTGATEAACLAWHPVTYSSRDTPETQDQARANNAAWQKYCEGK